MRRFVNGGCVGLVLTALVGMWGSVAVGANTASNPTPGDGVMFDRTAVLLIWDAGDYADRHHVYFGTNRTDVEAGTGGTYKGIQSQSAYIATNLVWGETYYWRVDEVNDTHPDSPWIGPVWSFMVASADAWNPYPDNGASDVPLNVTLTWTPGEGVALQELFIGTDRSAVFNAVGGTGRILGVSDSHEPPITLALGTTYYWRVDTYNQSYQLTKGDVWSFTTMPPTWGDPNLMGFWNFDEEGGSYALDGSGHANHGWLVGGVDRVRGAFNGALGFDGRGYVEVADRPDLELTEAITVGAWIRVSPWSEPLETILAKGAESWALVGNSGTGVGHQGGVSFQLGLDTGAVSLHGTTRVDDEQWWYVAGTYDGTVAKLYVNAQLQASQTVSGQIVTDPNEPMTIGAKLVDGEACRPLSGRVDFVFVRDYAVDNAELCSRNGCFPGLAWGPDPEQWSAVNVGQVTTLNWEEPVEPGVGYDVYWGTDSNTVENAEIGDDSYLGRVTETAYPLTSAIQPEWGRTYFWRVDTVAADDHVTRGWVWRFSVNDYLLIDDFESYGDKATPGEPGGRIWYTWIDGYGYATPPPGHPGNGSGSFCSLETQSAYGEGQMLTVDYDNTAPSYYSFVQANTGMLVVGSDWGRENVRAMSLWFKGLPSNTTEMMYVEAIDGGANLARVFYPDVYAVQTDVWTQWHISIDAFHGVDFNDVNSISLGIGTPGGSSQGGVGSVCFDDIRLYRRRCVPELTPGDATGDCRSNWEDVIAIAQNWLVDTGEPAGDVTNDGVVDMRDLAELGLRWMGDVMLWP